MEAVIPLFILLLGFSVNGQNGQVAEEEIEMEETMQEQELVLEEESMGKV